MSSNNASARKSSSSPLPIFFIAEACANIIGATFAILYPATVLKAITHPSIAYPITPVSTPSQTSIQLLQWLAGLTYALSAPLLIGARNTSSPMWSRRMVYYVLTAGEGCLVPIMLWQASTSGKEPGAITSRALLIAAGTLGSILPFRAWALFWKAEWFDNDEAVARKKQ